jgi:hypothetical protein
MLYTRWNYFVHMILYDFYCWKYELNGLQTVGFCVIFQFITMFNTIVGAGAASRYSSDQMIRSGSATLGRLHIPNATVKLEQGYLLFY